MQKNIAYSFEHSVNREDTNAEKYTKRKELFGSEDVEPLWVADMDIDTPSFVLDAVKERLQHPIVGYEEVPKTAFQAQRDWLEHHHNVAFDVQDFIYAHSVVASMNLAIEAFSSVGDKVIVQTPVYPPFFHSVMQHKRKVLKNSLKLNADGEYAFDIEDLKSKIDKETKLLLLCSPHNPVGRVWRREELEEILALCLEHNIVVFSDEIHSDLVYAPYKHIPFVSLSQEAKDITITAVGVGKSFNMAGFAMSSVVIPNAQLKERFLEHYNRVHFAEGSVLSHIAFESAYKEGAEWLEALKVHLYENYTQLRAVCKNYPQLLRVTPLEGTYLAWIDCRGMQLSNKALKEFFVKEAKLGLGMGVSFSKEGSGFVRLNFAISKEKMKKVCSLLERALEKKAMELI